jgi:peroxiredoxin
MGFNPLRAFVLALLSLAVMGAGPATQPSLAPPAVGDQAADFSLNTLDGKTVHLADLLKTGPVILIELRGWVGYQCPICNRQVGEFISNSKDVLATGARVVMVYQLKDRAAEFISGKTLPDSYFFVIDPDMKFVSDWHLRWDKPGETAYPSTFVIDSKGIIRFVKISHSHGDRATSAEVLKALAEKAS